LAWRCASDLAEMIGDREARVSADILPLRGPQKTGTEQIPGKGSMGCAAAALAEAYKAETRRLLRVHGRLVEELQPVVNEVYLGMDHILDNARNLVSLLVPSSPTVAAPLALTAGVFRSPRKTDEQEVLADEHRSTSPRRQDPQHRSSIIDAFRNLQAALPGLRQRLRKGQAVPKTAGCPEDGSTLANHELNTTACPSCGNAYMADSKFCRKCGVQREVPTSSSPTAPAPSSPKATLPQSLKPCAAPILPVPPSTPRRSPQVRQHKSPELLSPQVRTRPPTLAAIDAESPATRNWNSGSH